MKSTRLNSVAFTWLHGGHHLAPQYTKTGLPCCLACAKAASTSASLAACFQAMPSLWSAGAAAGVAAVEATGGAAGAGASLLEQAASAAATSVATRAAPGVPRRGFMFVCLQPEMRVSLNPPAPPTRAPDRAWR